jgi:hypothetical protein
LQLSCSYFGEGIYDDEIKQHTQTLLKQITTLQQQLISLTAGAENVAGESMRRISRGVPLNCNLADRLFIR